MDDPSRRQFLTSMGKGALALAVLRVMPACEETLIESKGESLATPFLTREDDWYYFSGLDTPVTEVPRIRPDDWSLSLSSGGTPVGEIDFARLKEFERDGNAVSFVKTMRCIKGRTVNPLPQTLTATGIFRGIPLRDVLAGELISGETTKLRISAQDGFQTSISFDRLQDEEKLPVILAFEMNGRPLTQERGGPVRLIIPEMWAFKNIKWITSIDATSDFSTFGTYETGEFAGRTIVDNPAMMALAAINTNPGAAQAEVTGPDVRLDGVALSGGARVTAVEVSVDGGDFVPVTVYDEERVLSSLGANALLLRETAQFGKAYPYESVWVPWAATVRGLTPGNHNVVIRALDDQGGRTMEDPIDPFDVAGAVTLQLSVS